MPSLGSLKEKTMTTTAEFAGIKVKVEYRPGAMLDEYYDQLRNALEDNDMDASTEAFCQVVVSWDVTEDTHKLVDVGAIDLNQFEDEVPDQVPVPIKPDVLKALHIPIPLYGEINRAIQENMSNGSRGTKKRRSGS